jgi:hypothetical protein
MSCGRLISFFESMGGDPRERFLEYIAAGASLP